MILCTPPSVVDGEYTKMALRYRIDCIKSINAAIATEGTSISDATIAKVLVMFTDEVSCLLPPVTSTGAELLANVSLTLIVSLR